jgi:hypothetical protein
MTPDPGVFGSLLVAAVWLMAVGLLAAWWSDGAIGGATLCAALAAAGLALRMLGR